MMRLSLQTNPCLLYRPSASTKSTRWQDSSRFLGGSPSLSVSVDRQRRGLRTCNDRSVHVVAMAGKVTGTISLALEAGKANPAPPVGPALGAKGVNIMDFCKKYNAATQDKAGQIIPVEITIYEDRSFDFILKTPPASFLLKQAAGIDKGSGTPNTDSVGKVTKEQIKTIAETKLPDLNCTTLDSAIRTIEGTAKGMGIAVVDA